MMKLLNTVPELNKKEMSDLRYVKIARELIPMTVGPNSEYKLLVNPNTQDIFIDEGARDYYRSDMDLFPMMRPRSIGQDKPAYLCIQPTKSCNLNCVYCFTQYYKDKSVEFLDFAIAKKFLDNFLPIDEKASSNVGFFGGEPMCAFDVVSKCVYYAAGKLSKQRNGTKFHMTTNGTLVDDKWIELFKSFTWTFIVSVDGPKELHDITRKTRAGNGSFDMVMEGLKRLSEVSESITLRGTYLPDKNISLMERVKYLNDLNRQGLGNWVSVEPVQISEHECIVREDGKSPEAFAQETLPNLQREMYQCADWFVDEVCAGRKPVFHNISKILERLIWKAPAFSECGGGIGYFTLDWDGNVHACHRLSGTKIGHIITGIDEYARCKWLDNRIYTRKNCMSCWMRYYCGGGCRQDSLQNMGDITIPNPVECSFRDIFLRASMYVMAKLKSLGKYDELKKLVPDPHMKFRIYDTPEADKSCKCKPPPITKV